MAFYLLDRENRMLCDNSREPVFFPLTAIFFRSRRFDHMARLLTAS